MAADNLSAVLYKQDDLRLVSFTLLYTAYVESHFDISILFV